MGRPKKIHLNGGMEVTALQPPAKPNPALKKIALVGTATSSCDDAPYDDESWEIWTLGCNLEKGKRITKMFELHTQHVLEEAQSWEGLVPYMKKMGKDCIMGHPNPAFPDATPFPKDEIVAMLGTYFTSSIAWMIGYAILQKPDCIGLWGIDMMGDEEYVQQRACCEYLLGIARGMNIVLTLADHSPLLKAERLYAFEHTRLSAGLNTMRRELNEAINGLANKERAIRDEKKFMEGQKAMLTNLWKRYG